MQLSFFKKNIHIFILVIGGLFLIGLPIFNMMSTVDFKWQGAPLDVPNYYYARLHEIKDGQPFMGNPYFWEHRGEVAPAFFLADWIVAIPMLLGLSMGASSMVNLILWTGIFMYLVYVFLQKLDIPQSWSAVGVLVITVMVYSYLIIPVSMQVIYPVFILFLIALWEWLQKPNEKWSSIFLVIASALTFYIYTYLWQIALVILGLFFCYFLATKQFRVAGRLALLGIITLTLSSPLFWYTAKQISHPFYWDSMERIGLVYTHLPTAVVYYSGRWIVLLMVLWFGLWRLVKQAQEDKVFKDVALFFIISGVAMLITFISNVFMGKELETAQHIDRFVKIWFGAGLLSFLIFYKQFFSEIKSIPAAKQYMLHALLLLVIFGGTPHYFSGELQGLAIKKKPDPLALQNQELIHSLQWLETHVPEPAVVWSNSESANALIPMVTKHYVLFANYGILHLLSSAEVEDRYLVSKYFDNLSMVNLQTDLRVYAGSARALHEVYTHNRWVKICHGLRLNTLGYECGELSDPISYRGENYFLNLQRHYQRDVLPNIEKKLADYHVQYMVKDKLGNPHFTPEKIKGVTVLYEDGRVIIYSFKKN